MEGPGQDADGEGNTQIGGDGVVAKDVSGSYVGGRDVEVTNTNIIHGIDPKEHAEILFEKMLLEEQMKNLEARNRENGSEDFSLINKRVVVLTGAGISAESGISTFQNEDGLWDGHRKDQLATHDLWRRKPELVWRYYQQRRRQLTTVEPNPAHRALVELSNRVEDFTLITQNVDDLHERAGSNNVIHMHGKLRSLRCETSNNIEERMLEKDLTDDYSYCNCCSPAQRLRPDIVWYGEGILHTEAILSALESCNVFIVVGTSGRVLPAANYVEIVRKLGGRTMLVNRGLPENIEEFQEIHLGEAGKILPNLVKKWT